MTAIFPSDSCCLLFSLAPPSSSWPFGAGSAIFFFCLPIHCSASPECTRKCNIILVYSLSLVLWNFLSQTNAAIKIFSLKFPCHVPSSLSKYHPGLICFYLCPKGFLKKRWFPVAMAALYWSVLSVEVQVKWLEQHSKRFPHQSTPASPVRR